MKYEITVTPKSFHILITFSDTGAQSEDPKDYPLEELSKVIKGLIIDDREYVVRA